MDPFVSRRADALPDLLAPLRPPRHPLLLARFGMLAVLPTRVLARLAFREARARALFTGMAAHATLPLAPRRAPRSGWCWAHRLTPSAGRCRAAARSASTDALVSYLRSLGGEIETDAPVDSRGRSAGAARRPARPDAAPGPPRRRRAPLPGYRQGLEAFQYGLGTFKVDWALDGPIPWRAPDAARAGTVHLGGTIEEIAEAARPSGRAPPPSARSSCSPSRPSSTRRGRRPASTSAWGYCHVPNGSTST